MLDLASLPVFVIVSLLLLVTPGPAVLFVVARSIDHGRWAGVVSSVGLGLGNLVHVVAVTAGLAAILTLLSALSPWPNITGNSESMSINLPPRPVINNLGLPIGYIRVVNGKIEKIRWQPAATDLACWFVFVTSVVISRGHSRAYRESRTRGAGLCVNCDYDLTGNVSSTCPECGTKIEALSDEGK